MATLTTRYGLRKPALTDTVNVTTDINDSMDTIDAALGVPAYTSATRPTGAARITGMVIFETDTLKHMVWTGVSWLQVVVDPGTGNTFSFAGSLTVAGAVSVGGHLTIIADDFQVVTSAGATWTNTTTLANTDISFNVISGHKYKISFYGGFTGAAAGDLGLAWDGGTATKTDHIRTCFGPSPGTTDVRNSSVIKAAVYGTSTGSTYGTDGTATAAIEEIIIFTATSDGTIILRGAQATANVASTIMIAGSTATCERIA